MTIASGLLVFKDLFLYILAVSLTRLTRIWGHQRDGGNVADINNSFPQGKPCKTKHFQKALPVLKWGGWGVALQEKTTKVVNFGNDGTILEMMEQW